VATRSSLTAALTAALLAGSITAAGATPQGYEDQDHEAVRFYANFEAGVLLYTAKVEDLCNGEPEPIVSARVFNRQDGSVDLKVNARDLPIFLYHSPLDAPEFIDQTCEALFDGDPATVPVEPFASGAADFKERINVAPGGIEEHSNGVNGFATGTAGTTWKVRTWADFTIDNGELIGDPAEFQGLTIHQVGH
jgi:hypothetical protein